VPSERRTEEDIRREIAGEREQLLDAVADLRNGLAAKRRTATLAGGALVASIAAAAALRVARRLRGE
jgi:hypothetical protein